MALDDKKYEKFYKTDGTGDDKAKSADLAKAEALWDLDRAEGCEWYLSHPEYGPLIFQLQQMQDEISALRDEISANKDKATFPGFGTSGSTALVGNTTVISSDQAKQITTNNGKITFPFTGLSTAGGVTSIAITHVTNKKGDEHALSFTVSIPPAKKGDKTTTKTATLTLI